MKQTFKLLQGNSLEVLKNYPDNHFDSVVTDPPYGLSFMGKKWDYDVPTVELWKEVLRVLKPGGHLVSFSSSRTYHRMTVNVEDAGFEVRDQLMWLYGSGFPKSHNIGKSYDKKLGRDREDQGANPNDRATKEAVAKDWKMGLKNESRVTKGDGPFEGWGTALKPAHEPIVLARKPLSEKTIVDNVIKWGTGGINIDGSRIEHTEDFDGLKGAPASFQWNGNTNDSNNGTNPSQQESLEKLKLQGRFPANIIHDGSDEVTSEFPDMNGKDPARFFYCAKVSKKERNVGMDASLSIGSTNKADKAKRVENFDGVKSANANVLFEIQRAKLAAEGKTTNHHPTVKPIALMSYLCKLITPTNGTILDPFMGSGSTGMAAKQDGFSFVGIDLDSDYLKIAEARISACNNK